MMPILEHRRTRGNSFKYLCIAWPLTFTYLVKPISSCAYRSSTVLIANSGDWIRFSVSSKFDLVGMSNVVITFPRFVRLAYGVLTVFFFFSFVAFC